MSEESIITDKEIGELELLLNKLSLIDEESLINILNKNPKQQATIILKSAHVLNILCGQVNKYAETAASLNRIAISDSLDTIIHNKNKYGPDFSVTKNDILSNELITENWEHKGSNVKAKKMYKTNWMFVISKDILVTDLEEIKKDFNRKMNNGGIVLEAILNGNIANSYTLNGQFMSEYLARKIVKQGTKYINLGSDRCHKCFEYHRIIKLKEQEEMFLKSDGKDFDWDALINVGKIDSQCE